jgi:hypothetical protein
MATVLNDIRKLMRKLQIDPAQIDPSLAVPQDAKPPLSLPPPKLQLPVTTPAVVDGQQRVAEVLPPATRPHTVSPPLELPRDGSYEPIRYDDATGQAINNQVRPRIANPTDYSINRLKQMEVEGTPQDRNGKLKSVGLGILHGFERGGLAGAASGGIYGGFRPNWDERIGQENDLEAERGRAGRLLTLDKATQGMESQKIEDVYKRAQAIKALQPPTYAPHYETRDDGTYEISGEYPQGRKVEGVPGVRRPESQPSYSYKTNEKGEIVGINTRNPRDVVSTGVKPPQKPSNIGADGLTPYQRAMIAIGRENKTYQRQRDAKAEARQSTEFVTKTHQYYANRLADAVKLAGEFDKYRAGATDPALTKEERDAALAQSKLLANQLKAYDDVYEVGESGGWPYAKQKQRVSVSAILRDHKGMTPDQAVQQAIDNGFIPVR